MTPTAQLIVWLNNAYAMEKGLILVLENHARDAQDHPDVRERNEQHLAETRRHAELVAKCLEHLGQKPSATKALLGNVTGLWHGASTGMYHDEIVKNFLADYAAEHFEIACYRSLRAAAEELGQPEIARICEDILAEEEAMAHWLVERIPEVTRMMLQQEASA